MEFKAKLLFARSMQAMFDLSLLRDAFFISTSENGTVRSRRISSKLSTHSVRACVCVCVNSAVCMDRVDVRAWWRSQPQLWPTTLALSVFCWHWASRNRCSVPDWMPYQKRLESAPPCVPTFGKCIKWSNKMKGEGVRQPEYGTKECETEGMRANKRGNANCYGERVECAFSSTYTADWFYEKIYNFEHQNRFSSISEQRIRGLHTKTVNVHDTQVHRCDACASLSNKSNHLSVLHIQTYRILK